MRKSTKISCHVMMSDYFLNICFGCLFAIPFCIREYLKGQVDLVFVFTGFCGFISLLLVFYSMLYLSICKDYQKISLFFLMGMAAAFGLAWLLVKVFHRDIIYSMLLSLTIGFFLTAAISAATIKSILKGTAASTARCFIISKFTGTLLRQTYCIR